MMEQYRAKKYPYKIVSANNTPDNPPYPLLKSDSGEDKMFGISREHGRSYIVGKNNDRHIISKGNGLSYSRYRFLNFGEFGNDTFGLLLREDAIRDFNIGLEVANMGIKTNRMEYILEIDKNLRIPYTGITLRPILLQYTVECPFRISDCLNLNEEGIMNHIHNWERLNNDGYQYKHQIAADVIFKNLRILHDNHVLHNAISSHNYTWALELLDFELARTPKHPYTKSDYERHVCEFYPREIIHTYQVINRIALLLNEPVDDGIIDLIMLKHGFDLRKFHVK